MDSRVNKIIALMETNPRRAFSLDELASNVNLSTPRLRLLFKAATGMSPSQYYKSLRMREAKSLLENTFLPVKQIAARVAINDVSHFVRDFKKIYGMSPTQYREWHHDAAGQTNKISALRAG